MFIGVVAAKLRIPCAKPVSTRQALRAVVALMLAVALVLGNISLAGSLNLTGAKTMPCEMQMGAGDSQALPDGDNGRDRGAAPPPCPMMVGGVCLMLAAVSPVLVTLADPPHEMTPVSAPSQAVIPHIISPLRRPPRSL